MTIEHRVPEGHYAELPNGLSVHYHDEGEGEAVIFVHGSGPGASGWSNFQHNYKAFAEAGFRALVPDMIGYGYSSKPDQDYPLAFMADSLVAFADTLGLDTFALVGNSLGGAVSIRLALDHPDRVSKLVLMAPGGLEEREVYMQMRGIRRMVKAAFAEEGLSRESLRKVFELQLYDPSGITDELIEERFQCSLLQPQAVFSRSKVPNQSAELANLTMPIFALWGREDQFCPVSGAKTIAENCTNARVLTVTECGHWVMVEKAELFNRWVPDFLHGRV
ncbi:MAG: alpha/beta fold hydrolase [Myxococcales bacterium]|nr:alpha/beta fold hydrolase [Myxococcales bacterium]